MHDNIPSITINSEGVCCDCVDFLEEQKQMERESLETYEKQMLALFEQVKEERHNYDALVLFSGGKDSTQLVNLAKNKYKLRVLAFGMILPIAKQQAVSNMDKVAKRLCIDLIKVTIEESAYKQYMRYALLNGDKYGMGEHVGCASCSFLFRWYSYKFAMYMDIPVVLDGRDKWQYGGVLFDRGNDLKERALKNEKVYGQMHDMLKDALGSSYGDSFLSYDIEKIRNKCFPSMIAPYTFIEYQSMDSLNTIESLGLDKNDFQTMYTNCDGVYLFDYITLKKYDCTSYHKAYAHGLRQNIPTITQLGTEGKENASSLSREMLLAVLDEYKKVLFYMGEMASNCVALTSEQKEYIMSITPYSKQIYGDTGIMQFIERFSSLWEFAKYFDVDLLEDLTQ
jgi:hypothetical protein